jgi:hypothetical protein
MEKTNTLDQMAANSNQPHGFIRETVEALHQLVIAVSAKLRHARSGNSPMGDEKDSRDIWTKIERHLEQVQAEHEHSPTGIEPKHEAVSPPPRHESPIDEVAESTELSEHSRQTLANNLHPHAKETLQAHASEHINTALIFAREGNLEAAKLRIGFAQSAMQTASRFMSQDEFDAFERDIEHRIKALIESDQPQKP